MTINRVAQYITGLAIVGIFCTLVFGAIFFYPVAVNYIMVSCLKQHTVAECREALKD